MKSNVSAIPDNHFRNYCADISDQHNIHLIDCDIRKGTCANKRILSSSVFLLRNHTDDDGGFGISNTPSHLPCPPRTPSAARFPLAHYFLNSWYYSGTWNRDSEELCCSFSRKSFARVNGYWTYTDSFQYNKNYRRETYTDCTQFSNKILIANETDSKAAEFRGSTMIICSAIYSCFKWYYYWGIERSSV